MTSSLRVPLARTGWRSWLALAAATAIGCSLAQPAPDVPTARESIESCSPWFLFIPLTERFAFRVMASSADKKQTPAIAESVEALSRAGRAGDYEIRVEDGRILRGRILSANQGTPKRAVLVATGNVATADFTLKSLAAVQQQVGLDFVFVDYRGYGRSKPGIPMLAAIVDDFVEVAADLKSRFGYSQVVGYGTSMGGVILANVQKRKRVLDYLLLDSVPPDLESYGCKEEYWAINAVSAACPTVHHIHGDKDREVSTRELDSLSKRISQCGGTSTKLVKSGHAFNDPEDSEAHRDRVAAVARVLTGAAAGR